MVCCVSWCGVSCRVVRSVCVIFVTCCHVVWCGVWYLVLRGRRGKRGTRGRRGRREKGGKKANQDFRGIFLIQQFARARIVRVQAADAARGLQRLLFTPGVFVFVNVSIYARMHVCIRWVCLRVCVCRKCMRMCGCMHASMSILRMCGCMHASMPIYKRACAHMRVHARVCVHERTWAASLRCTSADSDSVWARVSCVTHTGHSHDPTRQLDTARHHGRARHLGRQRVHGHGRALFRGSRGHLRWHARPASGAAPRILGGRILVCAAAVSPLAAAATAAAAACASDGIGGRLAGRLVRGGEGEGQESEAESVCRRERKRRQGSSRPGVSLLPTASGASMRLMNIITSLRALERRASLCLSHASSLGHLLFLPSLLDRLPRADQLPRYEYFILLLLLFLLPLLLFLSSSCSSSSPTSCSSFWLSSFPASSPVLLSCSLAVKTRRPLVRCLFRVHHTPTPTHTCVCVCVRALLAHRAPTPRACENPRDVDLQRV
jgi:hypothetical protein